MTSYGIMDFQKAKLIVEESLKPTKGKHEHPKETK